MVLNITNCQKQLFIIIHNPLIMIKFFHTKVTNGLMIDTECLLSLMATMSGGKMNIVSMKSLSYNMGLMKNILSLMI